MDIINISKAFNNNKVIDEFSLSISDNKITSIMGKSGCGKSTLLNIIAGLIKADSGSISSIGRISYIFQDDRLLPWLTAEDNIRLTMLGEKNTEKIFSELEITAFLNRTPPELSGGMKQRINIARALLYDYDILLMDEAFKGLDISLKKRVMNLIKDETAEKTVISVTHDMDEAKAFSDEILTFIGTPLNLIEKMNNNCKQTEI